MESSKKRGKEKKKAIEMLKLCLLVTQKSNSNATPTKDFCEKKSSKLKFLKLSY